MAVSPALHIVLLSSGTVTGSTALQTEAILVICRASVDDHHTAHSRKQGANSSTTQQVHGTRLKQHQISFPPHGLPFGLAWCFSLLNYQVAQHLISILAHPL